jgi:hypothetical protein
VGPEGCSQLNQLWRNTHFMESGELCISEMKAVNQLI